VNTGVLHDPAVAPGRRLLHREIADSIRRRIESGELAPRARVGSLRSLSEPAPVGFGVAKGTVERAVNELREEGLVETIPGSGIFVTDPAARVIRSQGVGSLEDLEERWVQRFAELDGRFAELLGVILDLTAGDPDAALARAARLAEASVGSMADSREAFDRAGQLAAAFRGAADRMTRLRGRQALALRDNDALRLRSLADRISGPVTQAGPDPAGEDRP
jgi:DNA-binding transcriptional regulator YhcF (GntR family)